MEKYFTLLFDRPTEPIFVPKGEERISFEVPTKYMPDSYQSLAQGIISRFGEQSSTTIKVRDIALPDLRIPLSHGRTESFSLFIPSHRDKATRLTEIFLKLRTAEDLLYVAASCRDRMNPQLFAYSLSVALLHRPDTKNVQIPQLSEIFPDKFLDSAVFSRAKEQANVVPAGSRVPIEIPLDYTASDRDPEHKVAYFREDVGVNLHHWHWHLIYPFAGPDNVVRKDRRGELFYHMHHQVMSRFNIERMCNNLNRVVPLENLREPLPQAYFPKMDQAVAGRAWPARPANLTLSDVNRTVDALQFTIADIERYRKNVLDAIRAKAVRNNQGQTIPLDEKTGIDIIGSMVEASPVLSPNFNFYGDLHNSGHNAIAFIHDPDHRFLESFAVMGDSTTAMRDPIFYRWHGYLDNLFRLFKDSLPPYPNDQLLFRGVTVSKVGISSPKSNPNTLNTHWTKSDVDLSRGLDFTPRGAVLARVTHLNHDSFSYTITANNANNGNVVGTVRIFIAPRLDENKRPLNFNDQRFLMIEMDKFTVTLKKGQNTITRKSTDSAITIPFESTFRDLQKNRPNDNDAQAIGQYAYCGCGWPQYMLVPKGTKEGYPMDLFVMISDYQQDRINQDDPTGCRTGISFCGLRDRKYPDARAMGYPFDRTSKANSMDQFRTPNMLVQQITVRFTDTIKARE